MLDLAVNRLAEMEMTTTVHTLRKSLSAPHGREEITQILPIPYSENLPTLRSIIFSKWQAVWDSNPNKYKKPQFVHELTANDACKTAEITKR